MTNNKTGAYPLSIFPETYLAKNIEDTINPGSTQDYQKTAGQENVVSPIGQPGRVNLEKTPPNDGTSSSKIKNLTTQSKSTIRDNKPNRRKGVIVCLVLFFLLTGTLGGAVKYREWVITSWPSVTEVYSIMGLTMLVQEPKLKVRNVTYKYLTSDTLKIHGELVSVSKISRDAPTLKIVFLDGHGIVVLQRNFSLSQNFIKANETLKFSTEINNPPTKAKRIEVDVAK
ncbi:MAG: hypothetical protein VYB39_01380 [Pseudomonadota bacterium]|nr:hypothetical protein [Pseudomonadota bacterium]